jgi:ArsR family transcriptional regulator, nickel/cobalt-responsive transcriptional repressor
MNVGNCPLLFEAAMLNAVKQIDQERVMKDPLASKQCAELLKALADQERLRIVQSLRAGPKNVSQITGELKAELANISHHLGILKRSGLVDAEKQGRHVVYRLRADVYQAANRSADHLDLGCCRLEIPKKG